MAVAAAIARAKAKKLAQAETTESVPSTQAIESTVEKTEENSTVLNPKKAAVAAAIARAKAKKLAKTQATLENNQE